MRKLSTVLSGVAGVYFVAGELTRQGYVASITSRNTKGIDILVSNENATKTVGVQVKTNQGNIVSWLLNKTAEDYFADSLFYIFVNLNNGAEPNYFIVPSKTVANHVKDGHRKWLSTPGRKAQKHNDTIMRQFKDENKEYVNRWELLGL